MELINNFFIFLTVVKIQLDLYLVSSPRRFALEHTTYRSMRHKVAAAPLRGTFFLTQHLVAPPPAGLYLVVLHLVPRSAGHTTCSGLRPTISSGRGSAYLLHLAAACGGTISSTSDLGQLLHVGAPPPAVLHIVPRTLRTYYIWGSASGGYFTPTPLNARQATLHARYVH